MAKSHRVRLMLDAEQLRLIHTALSTLAHTCPDLILDPPHREHFFSSLCRLILLGKDICEGHDKANYAWEQLQAEVD